MGPAVQSTPIPQRIAPLRFRQPVFIWTPVALALGLGWPSLMLRESNAMAMTALITGAIVFAASFATLAGAWLFGRAPRSRGDVIQHFLLTGIIAAIAAPFVLTGMLDAVATAEHTSTGLRAATPFAMAPLAVLLGLPVAFFYGIAFSFVALVKPQRDAPAPASGYHGRDVRHSA